MTKTAKFLSKLKEMGCTLSAGGGGFSEERNQELWTLVENMEREKLDPKMLRKKHEGWLTVRFYVACTFKDFRNERNAIHTKLYEPMKRFCESRKLMFILEEFSAGRNEPLMDPEFVYLALDALEQAYADNTAPYFLGLLGECAGLIPAETWLDESCVRYFKIPRGLSLLETEIAVGIMKTEKNPNGWLAARNSSFLSAIPFHQVQFIEESAGRKRAQFVKQKLWHSVPSSQLFTYSATTEGINDPHHQFVQFSNDTISTFIKQVAERLKKRITEQYVLDTNTQHSRWWMKSMMDNKRAVLRNTRYNALYVTQVVDKIYDDLSSEAGLNRICLSGEHGSGRSTIIGHLVLRLLPKGKTECNIKCDSKKKPYKVFFHFVSQTIDGDCVQRFFARLLYELYGVHPEHIPEDAEELRSAVLARLTNPDGPPVIIVIDDVDKLSDFTWLEHSMQQHVRVCISFAKDSGIPKLFKSLERPMQWIRLQLLEKEDVKQILNLWMRYVPRATVIGCRLPPTHAELNRPSTGKRQTADCLAELMPIEVESRKGSASKRVFTVESSDTNVAKGFWAAGMKAFTNAGDEPSELDVEAADMRHRKQSDGHEHSTDQHHHQPSSAARIAAEQHAKKLRTVTYSPVKCKIMATMLRYGVSLEKVKALAYFGPNAVADAELREWQSQSMGHLKIGVLCLLVVSKDGLREIELRRLMANEHKLLPSAIKRHVKLGTVAMTFKYEDSVHDEVQPIRWRQTYLCLRHHLIEIGDHGDSRIKIGSGLVVNAVRKRFFTKPSVEEHFRKKLVAFFSRRDLPWLEGRRAEELPSHLIALNLRSELFFADTEMLDHFYHPLKSGRLFALWEKAFGKLSQAETPLMETAHRAIENVKTKRDDGVATGGITPQQLLERLEQIARVFLQAQLYSASSTMLNKATEVEMGMFDRPRAEVLGRLHFLHGEIGHRQIIQTDDLHDFVAWDDLNRISYIIASFESAMEKFAKVGEPTSEAQIYMALCKLRLAWWNHQQELHVSSSSQVQLEGSRLGLSSSHASVNSATESARALTSKPYKTAAKLAKDAAEELLKFHRPALHVQALLVRAQCESTTEKITDCINRARDCVIQDVSPNCPQLLRVYGLALKLALSDADHVNDEQRAHDINDLLFARADASKHEKIRQAIGDLAVQKAKRLKEIQAASSVSVQKSIAEDSNQNGKGRKPKVTESTSKDRKSPKKSKSPRRSPRKEKQETNKSVELSEEQPAVHSTTTNPED